MTGGAKKPKELLADQELIGFTRHSSGGDQVLRRASSAKITLEDILYENSFEFKVRSNANGDPEIIIEQVEGVDDVFPGRAALVFTMEAGTSREEAEQLVDQMRKYISEPFLEKKT